MALIAINPDAVFEYSLVSDKGDDKTVFQLGTVDSFVRAYIDDSHLNIRKQDGEYDDVAVHHKYLEFVRFGLKGWKNFKDASGQEIPFQTEEFNVPRIGKRTIVSDASMKHLDLKWVIELGLSIITNNSLSKDESKN
jgi:hypothetical protein